MLVFDFDNSTNSLRKRKKSHIPRSTFSLFQNDKKFFTTLRASSPRFSSRDNSLKNGRKEWSTFNPHPAFHVGQRSSVNYSSSRRDVKSRPSRTRFGFQKAHPQTVGTYLGVKDPSEISFLRVPTSLASHLRATHLPC